MIGAGLRWFRRIWPPRLIREIGCSIRSMPFSPSTWQPRMACDSSQYWLTSTRTLAWSPRAFLIATTCLRSCSSGLAPIFSLKMRWRRISSICSASAMSRAVSPLARVQATSRLSRTRPPSSSLTGRPRRLPWASSSALSMPDLAKVLPLAILSSFCMAALMLPASRPSSAGARWLSMFCLMLSGLSLP
ncbi:hypothetical protein D9M71_650660 [compost metagenome]